MLKTRSNFVLLGSFVFCSTPYPIRWHTDPDRTSFWPGSYAQTVWEVKNASFSINRSVNSVSHSSNCPYLTPCCVWLRTHPGAPTAGPDLSVSGAAAAAAAAAADDDDEPSDDVAAVAEDSEDMMFERRPKRSTASDSLRLPVFFDGASLRWSPNES